MTPAETTGAVAPRVSDETLEFIEGLLLNRLGGSKPHEDILTNDVRWILGDLRDARAEIARLTAALAAAERKAWESGRDAAAACFDKPVELWPVGWRESYPALSLPPALIVQERIRHLQPPAELVAKEPTP